MQNQVHLLPPALHRPARRRELWYNKSMTIYVKILFFSAAILSGVLFFAKNSLAAPISAGSCSQADVQNAINGANDGDPVKIPAGTCAWAQNISLNNKSIALFGAGRDQTIITRNYPGTNNDDRWLIYAQGMSKPFRISGFTMQSSLSVSGAFMA